MNLVSNDCSNSDASGEASFGLSEASTGCSSWGAVSNSTGSSGAVVRRLPTPHRRTISAPPILEDDVPGFGGSQDIGTILLQAFQLRDDYMNLQEVARAEVSTLQAQLQAARDEVHLLRGELALRDRGLCSSLLRNVFSSWSRQSSRGHAQRTATTVLESKWDERCRHLKVDHGHNCRQRLLLCRCLGAWAADTKTRQLLQYQRAKLQQRSVLSFRKLKVGVDGSWNKLLLTSSCWRAWATLQALAKYHAEPCGNGPASQHAEGTSSCELGQQHSAKSRYQAMAFAEEVVVLTADGSATNARTLPWDRRPASVASNVVAVSAASSRASSPAIASTYARPTGRQSCLLLDEAPRGVDPPTLLTGRAVRKSAPAAGIALPISTAMAHRMIA